MYKSMLTACLREKFGRMYAVYYMLAGVIAVIAAEPLSYGLLFIMAMFTAMQAARMFACQKINCINNGYVFFRSHKGRNILIVALLADIPWLLFIIIKVLMSKSNILCPMILIWGYSVILGALIGAYINKEVIAYALIVLCFFFCIQKVLTHELYFRYVSPVLVFNGEVNIFNLSGICFLTISGIFMLLFLKKVPD
ncbi:MAG: hypothetical protein NC123_16515 [Butyrivibrio sp.]|nr:hypothetical protein [Acetatifactor muris]MCM1561122.1 hypothetical protein [Butyrivibrio sp.]